jgi:hypothetical protein
MIAKQGVMSDIHEMVAHRASAVGAFLSIFLSASFAPAAGLVSPPADEPIAREELSLETFGAKNPTCLEWNDGCETCRKDSGGVHCSTPGIACQPKEAVCRASNP